MVAELIWSPQARKDLLDIYTIIGLDNPAAAERLYTTIEAKAEALAQHPRQRAAPEFTPPRPSVPSVLTGAPNQETRCLGREQCAKRLNNADGADVLTQNLANRIRFANGLL